MIRLTPTLLSVVHVWIMLMSPTAGTPCSNPVPGALKMVRGVDATGLDLLPLDLSASSGFKSPVLEFTCDDGKQWINTQGVTYQMPDQIWHTTTTPAGWLSSDVQLYKTHSEVKKAMARKVGLDVSVWKIAFSASHSYTSMQHTILNESRYISDVSAFESATKVDLVPRWVLRLGTFAQMFVDNMISGTYDTDPAGYNQFIEEFGTHYFTTGNFGGYIRIVHETEKSYFSYTSDTRVEQNAKASFLKFIKISGGQVTNTTNVDSSFVEKSTKSIRYYGGETNLLADNGIEQWQPSVDRDPWLFSGQLRPISDLIADGNKKASMVVAVEQYMLRKYLDELLRLVHYARIKLNGRMLPRHNSIDGLEQRVADMKNTSPLIDADVASLGAEVDRLISQLNAAPSRPSSPCTSSRSTRYSRRGGTPTRGANPYRGYRGTPCSTRSRSSGGSTRGVSTGRRPSSRRSSAVTGRSRSSTVTGRSRSSTVTGRSRSRG